MLRRKGYVRAFYSFLAVKGPRHLQAVLHEHEHDPIAAAALELRVLLTRTEPLPSN